MSKKKGQTQVTVYQDWCKGCGICVAFCPGKVLEFNNQGKAEAAHPEECINCGFCELHCPDFAISVRPKEEITPYEAYNGRNKEKDRGIKNADQQDKNTSQG